MLELRLVQGSLLKKVLESIKDLITVANFKCSATGFSLQAMNTSQLALATLLLRPEGFERYHRNRSISLGMNLDYMYNMLKDAGNDDIITIKAEDGGETITFNLGTEDNFSENEMDLMNAYRDELIIPEVVYDATVKISSAAFSGICEVLSGIGDTVVISVTQRRVEFLTSGDSGTKNIVRRHNPDLGEGTIIEIFS